MDLSADGDLFDLAESLARLLDAPITIEDRDTIVIAYAGEHQDVDEARVSTILGRQVPVVYRDAIAASGVFEQLATSDDVIVVDLPEVDMVTRAVVAVRDGHRLVGSIWAAIPGGPSEAQTEALANAAPVVAARLREEHDRADQGRRVRTRVVSALIEGGELAEEVAAAQELTGPLAVIAIRGVDEDVVPLVAGPLTLHLSAIAPEAVCAPIGRTIYAVLGAAAAPRILGDFLRRYGRRDQLVVGIGTPAARPSVLESSRSVAEQVLEALARRRRGGTAATLDDVYADVLVDRLEPFLVTHRTASPLARLLEHDREHEAGLVEAVDAFLDAGEVAAAATTLSVHPNTVRNRLRRAKSQCDVDVGDPGTRLALMLDLRVHRPR